MTSPTTPSTVASDWMLSMARGNFPELYERLLVEPLFRPWGNALLDRVSLDRESLAPASRVLDVACGTGIIARLARERLGDQAHIVAIDRSPAMLAVARAVEPAIDWREGDAAEPPVQNDERFDVIVCHQGLQFFPDKMAAMRAMRRVLAPGGRVGIGVWRSLEENGLFYDLGMVAERYLGPIDDARHSFADADALAQLLVDAGFTDVHVDRVSRETRFALDPAVLARLNAMAVIGMTATGKAMADAERAEMVDTIVSASLPEVARYGRGGVLAFRTSANIAVARGDYLERDGGW
ncbi:MAG TPA: methyltransferase domain-containing protein [Gemmatimonadaceae bacterium]